MLLLINLCICNVIYILGVVVKYIKKMFSEWVFWRKVIFGDRYYLIFFLGIYFLIVSF